MENQYYPTTASSIIVVEPGECFDLKINADKLIKDFKNKIIAYMSITDTKDFTYPYIFENGNMNPNSSPKNIIEIKNIVI